jgi:hypothetical protein
VADVAIGVELARAGTRVASASVTSATAGSVLVVISDVGRRPLPSANLPRSPGLALRSTAATVGWSGLAWCAATLAEDRNLAKAPLGPALAALQGVMLVTGSTWPNRVACGVSQVATGLILSGAAARHNDPVGGAVALASSGMFALARVTGLADRDAARTTSAALDTGARIGLALAAARLASVGDERLF